MKPSVESQSAGHGAPVVCLHGIGGHAQSFSHQLNALSDEFKVISLSLPGYGGSAYSDGALRFDALSNWLVDVIADEAPVHLVGHSIGGMIAIEHALRQPKQIKSLTLIGTTSAFGGRDDSFKDAFLKARLAPLDAGKTMAEIAEEAANQLVGPIATAEATAEIARIMSKVPEQIWRDVLGCLVTFNRRADIGTITVPTLLIAGELDKNAPAKTMQKMAENMQNAQFEIIQGAGHMINQEAPERVNQLMRDFLGKQK